MAQEKTIGQPETAHDEIRSYLHSDFVPEEHLDLDKETAAYVGSVSAPIDEVTNKKLFWKVNKRILACMLGVSTFYDCARRKDYLLLSVDIFLSVFRQGDPRV
jgi:hypothetical protein